jgi:hypothetical protein
MLNVPRGKGVIVGVGGNQTVVGVGVSLGGKEVCVGKGGKGVDKGRQAVSPIPNIIHNIPMAYRPIT